jgi:hypothetical protein
MSCPICDQKPMNCDCTEAERRMYSEIEELQEQVPRWIAVSERLPEPNEPVLIYTEMLGRHVASVDEEGEWFCDYGGEWLFPDVTHWMPLPEPPEVK